MLSGVPIRTVQAYLSGEIDLTGEKLALICDVLGLELRPVDREMKGKRKPKGT